jgi:hypothetical protein
MGKRAVRVGKRGEDRLGQKKGGERERGSVREEQGSKRALRLEERRVKGCNAWVIEGENGEGA